MISIIADRSTVALITKFTSSMTNVVTTELRLFPPMNEPRKV